MVLSSTRTSFKLEAAPRADGSFEFPKVPPDKYTVLANPRVTMMAPTTLVVEGREVPPVSLVIPALRNVDLRIVAEEGSPPSSPFLSMNFNQDGGIPHSLAGESWSSEPRARRYASGTLARLLVNSGLARPQSCRHRRATADTLSGCRKESIASIWDGFRPTMTSNPSRKALQTCSKNRFGWVRRRRISS